MIALVLIFCVGLLCCSLVACQSEEPAETTAAAAATETSRTEAVTEETEPSSAAPETEPSSAAPETEEASAAVPETETEEASTAAPQGENKPAEAKISVFPAEKAPSVKLAGTYEDKDEFLNHVIFTTDAAVRDFRIVSIVMEDREELTFHPGETLLNVGKLRPGQGVEAKLSLPGAAPTRGVAYTAPDGKEQVLAVGISGKDGSLYLQNLNVFRWEEPETPRPMTEADLAPIRALFEADFSLYSQALTSCFDRPENVSLREFFYNGHMDCRVHPETYAPPTEREMELLRELHGDDDFIFQLDATVVSGKEMDADLMEVFGLTLEDTSKVDLDSFDYLEETDRYFLFKGDTNATVIRITDGTWLDSSRAELHYLGGFNEVCTVVMEQRGGHWYILSNASSAPAF